VLEDLDLEKFRPKCA